MKHGILGLLIFFLASITMGMHAQKSQSSYSVKGVLVDSLSNEGEPYATMRISLSESPTKPVRLAVTSDNGKFNEKLTSPGRYIISFSSVGKNTVLRDFTLSEQVKSVDLGRILMSEATEMLIGVEVVAQKPLV